MSDQRLGAAIDTDVTAQRLQALLQVSDAIGTHRELAGLFRDLARLLPQVVCFDILAVVLRDPEREADRVYVLDGATALPIPEERWRAHVPRDALPASQVWDTQQPLVFPDVDADTRFPQVSGLLRGWGIRWYCLVPLSTARRRVGVLAFGSRQTGAYGAADVAFLQRVSSQVAVAVDNALAYEHVELHHGQLATERDRWRALLEINNALVSNLELPQLFETIALCLRRVIQYDLAGLALHEVRARSLRDLRRGSARTARRRRSAVTDLRASRSRDRRRAWRSRTRPAADRASRSRAVSLPVLRAAVPAGHPVRLLHPAHRAPPHARHAQPGQPRGRALHPGRPRPAHPGGGADRDRRRERAGVPRDRGAEGQAHRRRSCISRTRSAAATTSRR